MGQWRIFLPSLFAERGFARPLPWCRRVPHQRLGSCWGDLGQQAPCLGSNSEEWIVVALDFLQIVADSKLKNS